MLIALTGLTMIMMVIWTVKTPIVLVVLIMNVFGPDRLLVASQLTAFLMAAVAVLVEFGLVAPVNVPMGTHIMQALILVVGHVFIIIQRVLM